MRVCFRKSILVSFVLLLLSLTFISFGETYEDEKYEFTLEYPDGWVINTNSLFPSAYISFLPEKDLNSSIIVSIEDYGDHDDFRNYTNGDFEVFKNSFLKSLQDNGAIDKIDNALVDFKKIKRDDGSIYIKTEIDFPKFEMKMIGLNTMIDGISYAMFIVTTYEDEKKYMMEFFKALSSFSHTNLLPPPSRKTFNISAIGELFGRITFYVLMFFLIKLIIKKVRGDSKVLMLKK